MLTKYREIGKRQSRKGIKFELAWLKEERNLLKLFQASFLTHNAVRLDVNTGEKY